MQAQQRLVKGELATQEFRCQAEPFLESAMDFLSYFALAIIIFVFLTLAYGIVAIHDIPYNIAKARNHPHRDAIHAAGWVSLFTLHAIWPFLWIWATIYRPERGYGFSSSPPASSQPSTSTLVSSQPTAVAASEAQKEKKEP